MKKYIAIALLALAGCSGLPTYTPEEQSDIVAEATIDSIRVIQKEARRVYDLGGTISKASYINILQATGNLTTYIATYEAAADMLVDGEVVIDCVKIDLSGTTTNACSREDVTRILVKIRNELKEAEDERNSGS